MSLTLLDPRRSALLVVDMQNAFCHPEGTLGISGVDTRPMQAVIEPIHGLVGHCRDAGVPVIWTRQEHIEPDRRRARKRLQPHTARRKRVAALAGTWDARLVDRLEPLADDPALVVRKHRFGAFHHTRLEKVLDILGADALLIAGVTANACVETTLREAYLRDYDVVAITDCIAGVNAEWERVAREVWAQYLGVLADSRAVARWLAGVGAAPADSQDSG